ncbi:hypothetical protein OMAG_002658 [Candidatus Omnitrophus magneticus]|uniref:Uncharacterized protein n=1 Tax=Candidatus Omnitrophus magneticus TaxID=1609969 RepID=A0A0F0CPX4_9BACT|nr:hypothetical protein OMAG_002658 [Candidatus Omnitrophus magneticus]
MVFSQLCRHLSVNLFRPSSMRHASVNFNVKNTQKFQLKITHLRKKII